MAIDVTFTGEFTLKELLGFKTIPQLKEMARLLGVKFPGSPKKQPLVNTMAKILTKQPELVVKSMFYYELKVCLDAIEGRMTLEYAEKSGLLFELNRFGFLYAVDIKAENKSNLLFSKEMADVLRPLIPSEMKRRETDGSLIAEKLALGCANLYGFTDMSYIVDYLPQVEKRIGHTLEDEEITKLFYPFLCATNNGKGIGDRPFMSPFSAYNGFNIEDEDSVEWGEGAKQFDFDTIQGYGEMPYPVIASPATQKLKKILEQYGKPGTTPDETLRDLWIRKQDESQNSRLPNFNDYLEFKNVSDATKYLPAIIDFQNAIPYWRLRGNSSEEIGQREMAKMRRSRQMPHISMGPNMRAMGIESFDQLQDMARRGESFPPFPGQQCYTASPKVGRNDPCPCGSGKKYKHCCGKN